MVALVLAVGGGLLGVLAFPRYSLWWVAPLSLAALILAVRGRSGRAAAGLGFLHGLAMLVPLLSWTGIQVGALPWLALATMEAGFHALGGWALCLTQRVRPAAPMDGVRRRGAPVLGVLRLLGTAAVWVGVEAAQQRIPFGGFAWSRWAFTQTDAPTLGLAALGGAPLVTFAVGVAAAALAELVRRPDRSRSRAGLRMLGLAATVVGVTLAGALVPRPTAAQDGSIRVAGIQGSVPKMGLDFNAKRRAVLDKHASATRQLAERVQAGDATQPDLVVWPENASDIDPYRNADAYREIEAAVDAVGAPTLVGTLVLNDRTGLLRNTVLRWEPGVGPTAGYAKRAPVPFAEYVPYRSFFRAITPLVDKAGNFEAGDEVGLMQVRVRAGTAQERSVPLGVLICFEVVPDRLVSDVVDAGAQMLVVPTNNATFGFTDESRQQLAISRLRAVEYGRAVAHVSTVGVSALIAPDGSLVDAGPLFTPTTLEGTMPLRTSTTIAARLGEAPEWLLTGLALGTVVLGLRLSAKPKRATRRQRQRAR